jgi:23S rRNA pseudouridine2604 synthase
VTAKPPSGTQRGSGSGSTSASEGSRTTLRLPKREPLIATKAQGGQAQAKSSPKPSPKPTPKPPPKLASKSPPQPKPHAQPGTAKDEPKRHTQRRTQRKAEGGQLAPNGPLSVASVAAPAWSPAPAPKTATAAGVSGVRISKLLAERGLCSRREADSYIEQGWVRVDGEVVTELGTRALPNQVITLDREASTTQANLVTVLLNKPIGYVSGQPEPGYEPAVKLITPDRQFLAAGDRQRRFHPGMLRGLAPAGRLDIDSQGLLVLTQDGRIARQLIGDQSDVEKEYLVRVSGSLDSRSLALLNHGLTLDGKKLKPAVVGWQNEDQLRFVLKEGRKRQIRRMCELVGLTVLGLKRVRIGAIRLGTLPEGQWRVMGSSESFVS